MNILTRIAHKIIDRIRYLIRHFIKNCSFTKNLFEIYIWLIFIIIFYDHSLQINIHSTKYTSSKIENVLTIYSRYGTKIHRALIQNTKF